MVRRTQRVECSDGLSFRTADDSIQGQRRYWQLGSNYLVVIKGREVKVREGV